MVLSPNGVQRRFKWSKSMTFHFWIITIGLLDPEIEIDFDAHGFLLVLGHFPYVHFTLLQKRLERSCETADFGQNDFFVLKKYLMKMSHMTKVIYETLVKSIVLNKFSLYYICIRGPEHENRPKRTFDTESHKNLARRKWECARFGGCFAKYRFLTHVI